MTSLIAGLFILALVVVVFAAAVGFIMTFCTQHCVPTVNCLCKQICISTVIVTYGKHCVSMVTTV